MSHNLQAKSVVVEPEVFATGQRSDTDTLQAQESLLLKACGNPLCTVRFPEGGMPQSPKRFCGDKCLQVASIIRRAANLYGLDVDAAHKALTKARGKPRASHLSTGRKVLS
jgi:hypothetical protein